MLCGAPFRSRMLAHMARARQEALRAAMSRSSQAAETSGRAGRDGRAAQSTPSWDVSWTLQPAEWRSITHQESTVKGRLRVSVRINVEKPSSGVGRACRPHGLSGAPHRAGALLRAASCLQEAQAQGRETHGGRVHRCSPEPGQRTVIPPMVGTFYTHALALDKKDREYQI